MIIYTMKHVIKYILAKFNTYICTYIYIIKHICMMIVKFAIVIWIGIFPLHKSGTEQQIQQSSWLTSKRLLGRSTPSQVVMVHGSTRGMRLDSADPMATSGLQRDNPQPWLLDSDEWCHLAECSFHVFSDFWCIFSTQRGCGSCFFVRCVLSMQMV